MYVMPEYLKGLPDSTLITSKDIARWLCVQTTAAICIRKRKDTSFPEPVANRRLIDTTSRFKTFRRNPSRSKFPINGLTQYWKLGDIKKYVESLNEKQKKSNV